MTTLANDVRLGAEIIERIRAAGIDEDDKDFGELVSNECDVLDRVRRILRASRHVGAQADALGIIIEQDRARKVRLDGKEEALRNLAAWALGELGLTKIEAPDFTASLRTGRPAVCGEPDVSVLPDGLCRVSRSPDRVAIRKALEAGEAVPGMSLGNAEPVLTVRIR